MKSFLICFYYTRILTFKIMHLNAWEGQNDRNMWLVLTSVIKFALLDGSTYVSFNIYSLYCTPNIIKKIKIIRVRGRGENIFRNLKRTGIMGCMGGDINFIKLCYGNRTRICTRRVN